MTSLTCSNHIQNFWGAWVAETGYIYIYRVKTAKKIQLFWGEGLLKETTNPWNLTLWTQIWRFGSDDVPFKRGDFRFHVSFRGCMYTLEVEILFVCLWKRNHHPPKGKSPNNQFSMGSLLISTHFPSKGSEIIQLIADHWKTGWPWGTVGTLPGIPNQY